MSNFAYNLLRKISDIDYVSDEKSYDEAEK